MLPLSLSTATHYYSSRCSPLSISMVVYHNSSGCPPLSLSLSAMPPTTTATDSLSALPPTIDSSRCSPLCHMAPTTTLPDALNSLSGWHPSQLFRMPSTLSLSMAVYHSSSECPPLSLSTAAYYNRCPLSLNNCSPCSLRMVAYYKVFQMLPHSLSQHGWHPQLFWMPTTLTQH